MTIRVCTDADRPKLLIYKIYFPDIDPISATDLISYLCYTLLTTVNVEPIGVHRVGEAIEFAVHATPQDEINLQNFHINRNGVDIYLLQDDDEVLVVNSCGYDFREHISDVSKPLSANARIVNFYRQLRKYNGRYVESGTITFWLKDLQHPLTHKIDKRRRCYFNDIRHDSLLHGSPESSHDLSDEDDTVSMAEEEALVGNLRVPSVTRTTVGDVPEAAVQPPEKPPLNRLAISTVPINPDLAPMKVAGKSKDSRLLATASVFNPPPITSPPLPSTVLSPVPPPARSKPTQYYNPRRKVPYRNKSETFKLNDVFLLEGITMNYKQFWESKPPRLRISMTAFEQFLVYRTEDRKKQYLDSIGK